ncbi:protein PET117 homolog, mitochondrial [Cloeon dipterum]|uniref:protein PET117 homolog, mitochondrial n=1 Tax=Cloeon dipterum TaxID=197152 RepID=UPI0032201573
MSATAKLTLALSIAVTGGTMFYVHYKQSYDRDKLHEGVLRDIERQQRRKVENLYTLQKQIDLTKELRKVASETE